MNSHSLKISAPNCGTISPAPSFNFYVRSCETHNCCSDLIQSADSLTLTLSYVSEQHLAFSSCSKTHMLICTQICEQCERLQVPGSPVTKKLSTQLSLSRTSTVRRHHLIPRHGSRQALREAWVSMHSLVPIANATTWTDLVEDMPRPHRM